LICHIPDTALDGIPNISVVNIPSLSAKISILLIISPSGLRREMFNIAFAPVLPRIKIFSPGE
tara:strand:+ start:204 stop:392 length:189 start_codon:yes stop_codon:yes gene_type:complete